ncbi:MAG TPA: nucleoside-diphosphate kinase [Chloroflexia bacterium]|nr:nucleoside-diphosphate kinase [Chloroflexia bacterium]
MERTLVLLKPDALQRGLIGEITARFERKGLKLVGMKMMTLQDALLDEHYSHLNHLPFFGEIKQFMMRAPVIATCWEGVDAVAAVRLLCGKTLSREADPGTIRGDFGMSIQANLVHASDSLETAANEVPRFFNPEELFNYDWLPLQYLYTRKEQGE